VFLLFYHLERGLVYVLNILFNVDWRKRYKINRGVLIKNYLMYLKISNESYNKRQICLKSLIFKDEVLKYINILTFVVHRRYHKHRMNNYNKII